MSTLPARTAGLLALLASAAFAQPRHDPADLPWWPEDERLAYIERERARLAIPDPGRLAQWHEMLAGEVHDAGSPGDLRLIERAAAAFAEMGLEVEVHWFEAYLSRPVEAHLAIVAPDREALPLTEMPVPGDTFVTPANLSPGFNAYSGTGDVTAPVVYVNRGTREDFARLEAMGVSLEGRIALARYGGNFRGYKAKFAEAAGAAGLLMYTDPADSGYRRGLEYPAGGWANGHHIQRGSIKTLPYAGDPLTPFVEASADAPRLDPDDLALPTIPVQPIGYAAAERILARLGGPEAPADWQGGLAMRYRIGGNEDLAVHLRVVQERGLVRTANVIGTLRGAVEPERSIVIGCHHDAWGFGAGDAASGGIALMEAARAFGERARAGEPPARTIHFALWGAEEHGIIGSVEWVESRAAMLDEGCVAYLNLDMAGMGPNFGASASPALERVIAEAARAVPQARAPERSVAEAWGERTGTAVGDVPPIGDLGGGSDHVGFWCHMAIPSAGLSAWGSDGVSYHSLYDNLDWYRKVVGEDYEPALMVARMTVAIASRLAEAPALPMDPARVFEEARAHLRALAQRGRALGVFEPGEGMPAALARLDGIAAEHAAALRDAPGRVRDVEAWNEAVVRAERAWRLDDGLPARPWYRSLYAAPDPDSGYGAWMLPGLRGAVGSRDVALLELMRSVYAEAMDAGAREVRGATLGAQ